MDALRDMGRRIVMVARMAAEAHLREEHEQRMRQALAGGDGRLTLTDEPLPARAGATPDRFAERRAG